MKRIVGVFLLLMAMAVSTSSFADEQGKAAVTADDIKKAIGLSIYLQGGYTYNLKDPDSGQNDLRVFDHDARSFTLDLAEVIFSRDAAKPGDIGYKVKLSAGEIAKWIHARGLGNPDSPFDLTEAYIDYNAPIGKGLHIVFGKWVTQMGAEVIEAASDYNYSRSLLFNYAIPFTHTGLKLSYAFNDQLTGVAAVVNGWDNFNDNNKAKTFHWEVDYTPVEQASIALKFMHGPEQDNNTSNQRYLFDTVATVKPLKNLTLQLNYDYAKEQKAVAGADAKWQGIAAIVRYDVNSWFSGAIRAEWFDDPQGFRTGTPQKVKEITVTPEFRPKDNLIIRPEYRHDWSDKAVFNSSKDKHQDTIALGVMYTW